MAEGFRRAGVRFDVAVDKNPDACDSYEKNLEHRPLELDVRDFLRMVEAGFLPTRVDLFVADPPCTPWSRAGSRLGQADRRDMLSETCELVRQLAPTRWLVANVPGLDDEPNWKTVQQTLGALALSTPLHDGWCVDYVRLDAADYGVPQHRVRPFWFGHRRDTPCLLWPEPTHGNPAELEPTLPGIDPLRPWVTCRQALGHLSLEEIGRPIRLRKREDKGHPPAELDEPARTIIGSTSRGDHNTMAVCPACNGHGRIDTPTHGMPCPDCAKAVTMTRKHPLSESDAPAKTISTGGSRHQGNHLHDPAWWHRQSDMDEPTRAITTKQNNRLAWPWDRPSTVVTADPNGRISPVGHHGKSFLSEAGAVALSEKAAAILQGFPDEWHFSGKTKRARWSQIGQAMPPPLAEAVARAIVLHTKR